MTNNVIIGKISGIIHDGNSGIVGEGVGDEVSDGVEGDVDGVGDGVMNSGSSSSIVEGKSIGKING